MGTLVLVRHGQASFLEADYDKLSPLGERQARLLGEHWARCGVRFDRVFHGPRVRQRRTAEIALAACAAAGGQHPEPRLLETLDEVHLDGLLAQALPELARREPDLGKLLDDFSALAKGERPSSRFERRIARMVTLWATGEVSEGVEPWAGFVGRVRAALAEMRLGAGSGARACGFTSAGTISAALQLALSAPPGNAADLMWRVRNSSVTEFAFSGERFSLTAFNGTPHLEDGALVTVR